MALTETKIVVDGVRHFVHESTARSIKEMLKSFKSEAAEPEDVRKLKDTIKELRTGDKQKMKAEIEGFNELFETQKSKIEELEKQVEELTAPAKTNAGNGSPLAEPGE